LEDKQQNIAIMHTEGPALILAGPGSGKTKVLTHHIKYLIDNGVSPSQIMVITFTRSAALEMSDRFKHLMPKAACRVLFGTFHSIFYRLLKEYRKAVPDIISNEKKWELLMLITRNENEAEILSNNISYYKSLIDKQTFYLDSQACENKFYEKLKEYSELLNINKVMDFDDIISMFYDMLNDESIIKALYKRFSYVCIDEFQDINLIQYEIVKKLFSHSKNIYAVGDEDQSIYGFRGASPGILSEFLNDFNNVHLIELVRNYRSFSDITLAANRVMNEASERLKKLVTENIKKDNKKHFSLSVLSDREKMLNLFVEDINLTDTTEKTCAVLLRTNKEVNEYKRILSLNDDTVKEENAVYETVGAYIAYIKKKNKDSLRVLLNIPQRNLPFSIIDGFGYDINLLIKQFAGTYKGNALNILSKHMAVMEKLGPFSLVMYLKNVVGLEQYYNDKFTDKNKAKRIFENLLNEALEAKNIDELQIILKNKISPSKLSKKKEQNITVSTFHKSKGLEYDYVFIPDVIEGKIPGPNAIMGTGIEEERRLLYVAMTRAKEKLYMYTVKNEESFGMLPSRFINVLI